MAPSLLRGGDLNAPPTAAGQAGAAIECRGVVKRFRLPHPLQERPTLKGRLFGGTLGPRQTLVSLRDVTFDLPAGRTYGLIGANGSGKSTLLRVLAGIYRPDAGSVCVRGKVATLLGLGVGFHSDLSGEDNILVNAALMGFSPREVRLRREEIARFSGLGDFLRQPIRIYSNGMRLRLAFSVAAHLDCDVLLIDEVLAVGDESFQARCFERLAELQRAGKTIVVATHELGDVRRYCAEAIWMDRGELRLRGEASAVADAYLGAAHSTCSI